MTEVHPNEVVLVKRHEVDGDPIITQEGADMNLWAIFGSPTEDVAKYIQAWDVQFARQSAALNA